MEGLRTIGQVAEQLHEPLHRVEYVVKAHNIEHAGRLGILRGFDAVAVERIRACLTGSKVPVSRATGRLPTN